MCDKSFLIQHGCRRRAIAVALLAVAALSFGALASPRARAQTPWAFFGGDASNTRAHSTAGTSATRISAASVAKLALRWTSSTVGDVSATPTVEPGGLYVPDYAGYLYKLDPTTGKQIWSYPLSTYTGGYAYSRSSPAIGALGEIVLGINSSSSSGAHVIAVRRSNGAKLWEATVDGGVNSYVTASPVIYNGRVYVGVAASEETMVGKPGFTPTFRGSVVALEEATGAVVWRFYTVRNGYTGASVWGGNPVVFPPGNMLLVGTGNNISIPDSAAACLKANGAQQQACLDPTDYPDSLLALDLTTGSLRWARRVEVDTWTTACESGPAVDCPDPAGGDHDFASAPNLLSISGFVGVADDRGGTSNGWLMGAGQKTGNYRGINPFNGGLFWGTHLGTGQILWGSAINLDNRNAAYVGLSGNYTNKLAGQNGKPVVASGGSWAALNLRTGHITWQVPTLGHDLVMTAYNGSAPGPLTYANGVVFAGSTSGIMVGLNAASGDKLWSFNAGGSIIGGASIFNETLYFGAGATRMGPGSVHKVFAFAVP